MNENVRIYTLNGMLITPIFNIFKTLFKKAINYSYPIYMT